MVPPPPRGILCGSFFHLLLRLLLLLQFPTTASAAQPERLGGEKPTLFAEKFDYSKTYRTNVCDRQRLVWNNTLQMPDALQGLQLSVVVTNYRVPDEDKYFTLDENGQIPMDNPGLFAVIMDEVAARAGFTWRESFGVAGPRNSETDGDKSWTDILHWGVNTFDISLEKWGMSLGRLEMGISFPTGWWDSSVILVESIPPGKATKRVVNLWSFLDPFETKVWLAIVGLILFTGMLHWMLENLDPNSDENQGLDEKPMAAVFYAALTTVGHFQFKPNTQASRILGFSWTFWSLIVASAYTANLASFLVSPQVYTYRISTIDDALRNNAAVCVQKNAVIQTILEKAYPDLNVVPKETETDIYSSLRLPVEQGGCDAAAHQFNTFQIYEKSATVNYDCSLDSEKRVVQVVPAGMASVMDSGIYCTSLISHVLDYHLMEMQASGFIEKAWRDHLNRVGTIECIRAPTVGGGEEDMEDTYSLGLRDVGGIFILHATLTGLALALAFFQFYYFGTGENRTMEEVLGVAQARQTIRASIRSTSFKKQDDNNNENGDHRSTVLLPGLQEMSELNAWAEKMEEEEEEEEKAAQDDGNKDATHLNGVADSSSSTFLEEAAHNGNKDATHLNEVADSSISSLLEKPAHETDVEISSPLPDAGKHETTREDPLESVTFVDFLVDPLHASISSLLEKPAHETDVEISSPLPDAGKLKEETTREDP